MRHSLINTVFVPALLGGIGALALGSLVMIAPFSPLPLGSADATLGQGLAADAVIQYAELGRFSPSVDLRRASLERAASVYALELDDRESARKMLALRLSLGGDAATMSALREELAELYLMDRDPEAAAKQYYSSYRADPSSDEASQRMVRSAELSAQAGNRKKAGEIWRKVMKTFPERSARANLGLGELYLSDGRTAKALSPFQAAARSNEAAVASAARMGLAACYERLGELEGALAELDLTDVPDPVRERRKAALRERALVAAPAVP